MKILDITPERFLTYASDKVKFHQGLTVLVGPNGSGKTALGLEAVCWTLWGRTARGTVPDGDVSVTFAAADGQRYVVRRSRKGKRGALLNLCRQMEVGDDDMTGQTTGETQAKVDALAGSWERFCAERVFSNRLRARFGSATDKERKALLESVLGLERHERAYKVVREELGVRKGKLAAAQTTLAAARAAEAQAGRAVDAAGAGGAAQPISELRAAVRARAAQVDEAWKYSEDKEREARETARRAQVQAKTRDEAARTTRDLRTRRMEKENALARLEAKSHEALAMGDCPVCLTPAADIPRAKLEAHFKVDLDAGRILVGQLTDDLAMAVLELAEAKEDADQFEAAAQAARRQADAATRAAKGMADDTSLPNLLAAEERRAENEASARAALEACEADTEAAEISETQALRAVEVAEAAAEALGPKGARVARMDGALALLEVEASRMLARLPVDDGGPLGLRISSKRDLKGGGSVDEVSIEIAGAGGGEYDGTSDGERARIDVALMLGMSTVSGGEGFLVFDEIFDPLDGAALEAIAEVLADLAARRQVVVITHNPRFLDLMPASACWKVRREGGRSIVEQP